MDRFAPGQHRHELLGPLERLDRDARLHAQRPGLTQNAAGQRRGALDELLGRGRADEVGVRELGPGAEALESDRIVVNGVAFAKIEYGRGLGHAVEAVVDERLARPKREVDAVVLHLRDLTQEPAVLVQAPGYGPVGEVVHEPPAADAHVRFEMQLDVRQPEFAGTLGQHVLVDEVSNAPPLDKLVHGPEHCTWTATGNQQRAPAATLERAQEYPLVA